MDANQVTELIQKTRADAQERRRAAAEELRVLLLNEGKPGKSDHTRLFELAGVLGLQPEQLPEVLDILQKLARYDQLLTEEADRKADLSRAIAEVAALEKVIEDDARKFETECAARREPVYARKQAAETRVRELAEPRQWRVTVAAKWAAIVEGVSYEEAFEQSRSRGTPHGVVEGRQTTVAPRVS